MGHERIPLPSISLSRENQPKYILLLMDFLCRANWIENPFFLSFFRCGLILITGLIKFKGTISHENVVEVKQL